MTTRSAEANDYVCPKCGGALALDRAGQGFVRHIAAGRNCQFESGLRDVDDGRLMPWRRYSACLITDALCIGDGMSVPETIGRSCLVGTNLALEPAGERFLIVRIDAPGELLIDVRRRGGVVEELRVRPSEVEDREPAGWEAIGDISFGPVMVVGDAFDPYLSRSTVDVRAGRYVLETTGLVGSPRRALRARWWRES